MSQGDWVSEMVGALEDAERLNLIKAIEDPWERTLAYQEYWDDKHWSEKVAQMPSASMQLHQAQAQALQTNKLVYDIMLNKKKLGEMQ